ncbi:hypothetical protein CN085_03735 [Sinorhizobium meliloti]|nr:hypothetical protein CN189_00925 [Sinorhizobium meliloti]RVI85643.1 hypothetical protein CN190_16255 [Sinorhizobium meliloti]RVO70652.1 hypothetical protein CN087_05230 [Sinorhizobium meliloti]RVP07203.1 hypothetical protein CN083_16520 [Sinorhizobium meliloti]RVP17628.1 hypothetical protein CN085_03735 [Sinorhizobium meliloti]
MSKRRRHLQAARGHRRLQAREHKPRLAEHSSNFQSEPSSDGSLAAHPKLADGTVPPTSMPNEPGYAQGLFRKTRRQSRSASHYHVRAAREYGKGVRSK